jgi:AcrR family transcriptional regulator
MSGTLAATGALRHQLPREFIDRHKRKRILAAVCELAHEHGAGDLTTTLIAKRAKVTRPILYELFGDKAGCLKFACEEARRHLVDRVEAAGEAPGPWLERMDGAIGGLLEAAAEQPLLAELGLVHAAGMRNRSGPTCTQAVIEALVWVARGGREAGRQSAGGLPYREPQSQAEELVACAIVSVLALRVRERAAELPGLRQELVEMATRPFLEAGRWRSSGRQGRAEAQAGGIEGAAYALVEAGEVGAGALGCGEGEAVGEADSEGAAAGGGAGEGGVGGEQADAERGDRVDGGAQVALLLRRADQRLGVVDRAQEQLHLIGRETREGGRGGGVVGIGAIEGGDDDVGVENAGSQGGDQTRSSERSCSR